MCKPPRAEALGYIATPHKWGFGSTCMYEKAPFMGRRYVAPPFTVGWASIIHSACAYTCRHLCYLRFGNGHRQADVPTRIYFSGMALSPIHGASLRSPTVYGGVGIHHPFCLCLYMSSLMLSASRQWAPASGCPYAHLLFWNGLKPHSWGVVT